MADRECVGEWESQSHSQSQRKEVILIRCERVVQGASRQAGRQADKSRVSLIRLMYERRG